MQFDVQSLRAALRLVTDKMAGGATLDAFSKNAQAYAREHDLLTQEWPVVTTLSRFIKSNAPYRGRNINALEAMWAYLNSVESYASLLKPKMPSNSSVEDRFLLAMAQFFQEPNEIPTTYDFNSQNRIGDRLVGRYTFTRPSWRSFAARASRVTGEMSVSVLDISKADDAYRVAEFQDYPRTSLREAYHQMDRGGITGLGKYIYFLMKESHGTSVKFGVIRSILIENGSNPIDWFSGVVYVSSSVAFYKPAKFFCRRIYKDETIIQGPIALDAMTDIDARTYLIDPDDEDN